MIKDNIPWDLPWEHPHTEAQQYDTEAASIADAHATEAYAQEDGTEQNNDLHNYINVHTMTSFEYL